jgi:hypothetical protein
MDSFTAIQQALEKLADAANWGVVGALVAAGVVSMAILQVIKELTPIRRGFQRWWVRGWIAQRCNAFKAGTQIQKIDPQKAEDDLIDLSTGGDDRAFFELAAEQLIAQMNAAAQAALDTPSRYKDLLAMLSEGVPVEDLEIVIAYVPIAEQPSPQNFLDARNRVANRIQRNLDGMQIALASRWQFWMQGAALAITVVIVELAVMWDPVRRSFATAVLAIPVGIVGGYIAPVAKDLVAALKSLRA